MSDYPKGSPINVYLKHPGLKLEHESPVRGWPQGRTTDSNEVVVEFWGRDREMSFSAEGGFVSDCASIPRYRWSFRFLGWLLRAIRQLLGFSLLVAARWADVHDVIYRSPDIRIPRSIADHIMFEGWKQNGISCIGGGLAYIAVRSFGKANNKPRSDVLFRNMFFALRKITIRASYSGA